MACSLTSVSRLSFAPSAQAGKGVYYNSPNASLDSGGMMWFATSLFASGMGPVPESYYPYHGRFSVLGYNKTKTK